MILANLCLILATLGAPADEPLKLVGAIELPNVHGRIDHMAYVAGMDRLWIAALENGTIEIVDLAARKHERSLTSTKRPTGIAHARFANSVEGGYVFVANSADGRLDVYHDSTGALKTSVEIGPDVDNVRWEAFNAYAIVGYGEGALAVVAIDTWKVRSRIELGGHPESFQVTANGRLAYVNVPALGAVVCVDLLEGKVVGKIALDGQKANYPLVLDEKAKQLLVGCRTPSVLVTRSTDLLVKAAIGSPVEMSGDVDDLDLDFELERVYAACGAGFLDVFQRPRAEAAASDPRPYELLARVPTAKGARTSTFVPEARRLFLAVPQRDEQRCEIRIYETPATR